MAKTRMLLSKELNQKNFASYVDIIKAEYPDAVFKKGHRPDNKENLMASLPAPLGCSLIIDDGRIQVLDKLSKEEMQKLAYLFHLLGIKDYKFNEQTNFDFAQDFQDAMTEVTGAYIPPVFEDKGTRKISANANKALAPEEKAEEKIKDWFVDIGKEIGTNVKFDYFLVSGGFELKIYNSFEDMNESGRIDAKTHKVGDQKWEFYLKVTPEKIDGRDSLNFQYFCKEGKDISDDQASNMLGAAKASGITQMKFGPMKANDKTALMKACAKRGIIPITQASPGQYQALLNALKEDKNQDGAAKLDYKERLLIQIQKNNMVARGETRSGAPAMNDLMDNLEMEIASEYMTTKTNPETRTSGDIKALSSYDADKIAKLVDLCDKNHNFTDKKKIELKTKLLKQITATKSDDPAVKDWMNILEATIKLEDVYTQKFFTKIENAINSENAEEIYSVTCAVGATLDKYRSHLTDPHTDNGAFDVDKLFEEKKIEAQTKFVNKMASTNELEEEAISKLTGNASKVLRSAMQQIKRDFKTELYAPEFPDGELSDPQRKVIAQKRQLNKIHQKQNTNPRP